MNPLKVELASSKLINVGMVWQVEGICAGLNAKTQRHKVAKKDIFASWRLGVFALGPQESSRHSSRLTL